MLTLLLMSAPAHAWAHTYYVWSDDDFPLSWHMDDDPEDSLEGEDLVAIIQLGWDGWDDAECAAISEGYVDTDDHGSANSDGTTVFYWDDPGDEMDVGVLGVTYSYPGGSTQLVNGTRYTNFADADITMNDNVDWASPTVMANGTCSGSQTDVEGVLTHEIGHLYGLAHSCEDGEVCNESVLREATMYWSVSACDGSQTDINEDDIDSITALYGPYGEFSVIGGDRYGGTPLEVAFEITSEQSVLAASWNFGDGSPQSEELAPVHVYETAGQFTVSVSMDLDGGTCGAYTYKASELAYVVACEPPAPEEGADGFFTMSHLDGLTYETQNRTDVSVYGCIDTIQWEVYKGSSDADITPENLIQTIGAWSPKITFPNEGSFLVVMNVGGPGGLDAGYLTIDAVDVAAEGTGCATGALAASFGGLVLAGLAALRRRGARA